MSITSSDFKEAMDFLRNHSLGQINKWIQTVAAFLTLFVLLNCWHTMPLSWNAMPLWGTFLGYLANNCFFGVLCVLYIVFHIVKELLIRILSDYDFRLRMPYYFTLMDCVDTLFSLYYLLFSVDFLVKFCNGYIGFITHNALCCVYTFVYIAYIFLLLIGQRYTYNECVIGRVYTGFCDCNYECIYQHSLVVYNGKTYEVDSALGIEDNKKYILSRMDERESISLEDAVKDKNGKVVLVKQSKGK